MFAYASPDSFRAWNDPTNLASGEVYFDHQPSAAELASAFPNYVAPAPSVVLTALQYVGLFTSAEMAAIVSSTDVQVKMILLETEATAVVTLSDPRVKAGLDYLVSVGLLTSAREAAILAAPTQPAS